MAKIPCEINGGLDYSKYGMVALDWTGRFDSSTSKAAGTSQQTTIGGVVTSITISGNVPNSGSDYTWNTNYTKTFSCNRPGWYRVVKVFLARGTNSTNSVVSTTVTVDGTEVTSAAYNTKVNNVYKVTSNITTTTSFKQVTSTSAIPFILHLEFEYLGPAMKNAPS